MSKNPTIELTIPADLKYSALVRGVLHDALSVTKVPHAWIYKLTVVLDELFMNAVKYGSREGDMVNIMLYVTSDMISFEVHDTGNAHAQEMSADDLHNIVSHNALEKDITKQSGRGLALFMKSWVDNFTISKNERGGLTVSVEKQIHLCTHDVTDDSLFTETVENDHKIYHIMLHEALLKEGEEYMNRLEKAITNMKGECFVFDFKMLKFLSYENLSRILALETRIIDMGGKVETRNVSHQEKALFETLKGSLTVT